MFEIGSWDSFSNEFRSKLAKPKYLREACSHLKRSRVAFMLLKTVCT